ncbi:hypothetical protein A2V49_04170 [candidate division WWE3 bacterium RBG_19FT_COMBO_34_6]|uniref:Uncharacterized protein n=1 Tax=candidate division WWE3 bacterium RBG_19FT_COMBO_34_6 TaxID=1802612 RepID=A0A1F4ULR8_UNCKA|nr:MAG: hypothetical protein A2V49_04170 [candidate division WWE3 bacterium RBG_19FT_COMBO_34_6]
MEIWTSNTDEQDEEYFSIANKPTSTTNPPKKSSTEPNKEEAITALGGTYEVKSIPLKKAGTIFKGSDERKKFPMWLAAVIIAVPIIILFTLSAISAKKETDKKDDAFLFKTIESKYFTMSYGAEYTADSSIDKKVPFLEKHTLTTPTGGDKTLSIMVKDVKFDYSLDENTAVRARRENSAMYKELPYDFHTKQGLYFTRLDGNYESLVVFIDRSKSLLYEIMFFSPSNFAQNTGLEEEFKGFLSNMTLL